MIFSIIVPIYNTEKFLKKCLDSILFQTLKKELYEVILINDGSTDNCMKIINDYSLKIKNIKIINRENKGLLYTRIEGVKESKGEYVLFLDSDDCLPVNCLNNYYNEIRKKDYDIIRGNYYRIKSDNIEVYKEKIRKDCVIFDRKEMYKNLLLSDNYCSIWGQIIKRKIILKTIDLQILDTSIFMGEDVEINQFLYKIVNNMKLINKGVYCYRENNSSVTHTYSEERIKKNIIDIEKVYSDLIKNVKEFNDKELNKYAYLRYLFKLNGFNYIIIRNTKKYKDVIEYLNITFNSIHTENARKTIKYGDIIPKNRRLFVFLILKNVKKTYYFLLKTISFFSLK